MQLGYYYYFDLIGYALLLLFNQMLPNKNKKLTLLTGIVGLSFLLVFCIMAKSLAGTIFEVISICQFIYHLRKEYK